MYVFHIMASGYVDANFLVDIISRKRISSPLKKCLEKIL